jgi:hypothetical protein
MRPDLRWENWPAREHHALWQKTDEVTLERLHEKKKSRRHVVVRKFLLHNELHATRTRLFGAIGVDQCGT